MNISFHTGKSAMIAQSKALNIYGNNIANVNTVGYQTLRPSFADCIYDVQRAPQPDWQTGHGTYIQKTDLMFSESHFNYTERPQDFAIAGEGFFAVQDRWGDVNYTRDGAFAITQLDGVWYLVSSSGEYVLDYDKNRIVVPFKDLSKGEVKADIDWNEISDRIGTFTLTNGVVDDRNYYPEDVRYTYTGNGYFIGEDGFRIPAPEQNLNAAKELVEPVEGDAEADPPVPPVGASISTADGYFAVRDHYGKISYTRDGGQLSIQKQDDGKWYLGLSSGELLLSYNLTPIPVNFVPTVDDVDLEELWNTMQLSEENELAVRDSNGEKTTITIDENTEFSVVEDGGKYYVAIEQAAQGDQEAQTYFILNKGGMRIQAPNVDGNYYRVDWDSVISAELAGEDADEADAIIAEEAAKRTVGVFTPTLDELASTDTTRYKGDGAAADVEKTFDFELKNAGYGVRQADDGTWYLINKNGTPLYVNGERVTVDAAGEDDVFYAVSSVRRGDNTEADEAQGDIRYVNVNNVNDFELLHGEDGSWCLVTADGDYVLDNNLNRIAVNPTKIKLGNADSFFAVEGANGISYTRNVSFDIAQGDDGAWYLVTAQGEYVLDNNNQRIMVDEGNRTNDNVDWDELREMVGVFEFPNPYGIEAWGTNRYVQTGRSGEAVACRVMGENGDWIYTMDKLQGTLIVSNVDLATQMVKLIETQRAYQISSRVVTTSDELARIANNIR